MRNLTVVGGMGQGRPTVLVVAEQDFPGELTESVDAVRGFTGSGTRLKILRARRGTIPRSVECGATHAWPGSVAEATK
ncbi:hypothetical protein JOL79_18475 [Microbispora sp. RL4-1S]|uniref:Uncharacterized protein n=1 Tax=Microbispora oryzae TaxID=2806554 RepID=A0A940WRR2_9ACTN|nr:hypothetical protein [Microbispora oryzae]MBP2705804.1 hypothetical protein [Microbispora oryzae]